MMEASFANYADEAAPGRLLFMDSNLTVLQLVMRNDCVLPENVKWTADCNLLVMACDCEGDYVPDFVMAGEYRRPVGLWYKWGGLIRSHRMTGL